MNSYFKNISFFIISVLVISFSLLFFSCASTSGYKSADDCVVTESKGVKAGKNDWGGDRVTNIKEPNSISGSFDEIEGSERNNSANKSKGVEISR